MRGHEGGPMRSPVNWALLGLIIERPSYAYDLAQRFERRFGQTLVVSSVRHIYTAVEALSERGLVEEIPGSREGRQPRPSYRATERGHSEYREWLVGLVCEDRQRRAAFVLALGALVEEPELLDEVIARCEQSWLTAGQGTPIAGGQDDEALCSPLRKLIVEEDRLIAGAKLAWVQYAREALAKRRRER